MAEYTFEELLGQVPSEPSVGGKRSIQDQFLALASTHGFEPGSGLRTREEQDSLIRRGVTKARNSQHLTDTARDFRVKGKSLEEINNFVEVLRNAGFEAFYEDGSKGQGTAPHIHSELPKGVDPAKFDARIDANVARLESILPQEDEEAGPKEYTFEDLMGQEEAVASGPKKTPQVKAPDPLNPAGWVMRGLTNSLQDNPRTGLYDRLKNRLMTSLGYIKPGDVRYSPSLVGMSDKQAQEHQYFLEDRALRERAQKAKFDREHFVGEFTANIGNPIDLIYNEGLGADAAKMLLDSDELIQENVRKARNHALQQRIVANPKDFPEVSVEAAKKALAQYAAERDEGVAEVWDSFKKAAEADPQGTAAEFTNALIADPEMLYVPQGLGLNVIRGTRVAKGLRTTGTARRVAKTADRAIDAGLAGAGLNVAMTAADEAANSRPISSGDLLFSGGMGFGLGAGAGGAAEGITQLLRATSIRLAKARSGRLTPEDLENAMKDQAKEDVLIEQVIAGPYSEVGRPGIVFEPIRPAKEIIETQLGIKNLSPKEREAWHRARHEEIKKVFADNWNEADYLAYKAQERLDFAEARAKQLRENGKGVPKAKVKVQTPEEKMAQLRQIYDESVRKSQEPDATEADLKQPETIVDLLDQEELINAAGQSTQAVDAAVEQVKARDAKLPKPRGRPKGPKGQKGEVDPRLAARLGLAGLFGIAGYNLGETDEDRMTSAFLGGLTGLIVPGGGNIKTKLRQAGVMSSDGTFFGLAADELRLARQGKIKIEEAREQVLKREAEVIDRAKKGDEVAYKELFDKNFNRTTKQVKKYLTEAGNRLGLDPEDVAIEAMTKAFLNIDKFDGKNLFSTWLYEIARNEALNTIRSAQAEMRGGSQHFSSMYNPSLGEGKTGSLGDGMRGGHLEEDITSPIRQAVEGADSPDMLTNNLEDTPEAKLEAEQTWRRYAKIIDDLPPEQAEAFLLNRAELLTAEEIAAKTNSNLSTVLMRIKKASDTIEQRLQKEFLATRRSDSPAGPGDPPKRGRGRPRKQSGEIDPRLLKVGALASLGALAGSALVAANEDMSSETFWPDTMYGAGVGAMLGLGLSSRNPRTGQSATNSILGAADHILGATSTRVKNISPRLWFRTLEHYRKVLTKTHGHLKKVDPFLIMMEKKLSKQEYDIVARAILTGKPEVTERLFAKLDPKFREAWKDVRSSLDSLKDQLVDLGRFKKGEIDYFPRIVKDIDGLLKALDKEVKSYLQKALDIADRESIKKRGTNLTDIEKSILINKVLKEDKWRSQQPGFAKHRGVEDITPELQKFYATPTQSLHSYIRSAVNDIERAKFFGEHLRNIEKGSQKYTDTSSSIGELVLDMQNKGEITAEQAEEVASMLRSLLMSGEKSPHWLIQGAKDLSYAGLLGNAFSASVQLGDAMIQTYTQGLRPAMTTVVHRLRGKHRVRMEDFGLADHLAEEFVTTTGTARFLDKALTYGLFKSMDKFGKDIALNSAILNMERLAKSDKGIQTIVKKYGKALGVGKDGKPVGEMKQLINDLQKGETTDLVNAIAFAELSRTQPVSKFEMPQAYLNHPNGRLLYMFKTFVLKQLDLMRRDAFNEIKAGNVKEGLKNLTKYAIIAGVAGTATASIKDLLLDVAGQRELGVNIGPKDIAWNAMKTLGLSKYIIDKAVGVSKEEAAERRAAGENVYASDAAPLQAAGNVVLPPWKMWEEIITGDKNKTGDRKAWNYLPVVGPVIKQQQDKEMEKSQ